MSGAHGFELPTSSIATLAAAIGNSSNNGNGDGSSSSNGNKQKASALSDPGAAAPTATPAAAAALLPARRPRHQITRSISEISPPTKMHRHRHSHHHHPTQHLHHGHRRENSKLLLLDERSSGLLGPIDSRVLGGRSSLDMTRSELPTPNRSSDSSRRASVLVGPMIGRGENSLTVTPPRGSKSRKANTAVALLAEKERTASRLTGLTKSLVDLIGFSTATTRRLDETYYSVLEKKTTLQNTISAIKELAAASRHVTSEFERGAEEMVRDIDGQLGAFGQFNEQESRIEALQGRVEAGRARIRDLSERVDVVRRRIEGWESADREWQEKTRKRLRIMWIVMSVVSAVLILLFIGVQYAHQVGGGGGGQLAEGAADAGMKIIRKGVNRSAGDLGMGGKTEAGQGRTGDPVPPIWEGRQEREEGDQLRVFDEL